MCFGQELPSITKTLRSTTTSTMVEEYTEWILVTGVDEIRCAINLRGLTGALDARPAYQLATERTDRPDDWVNLITTYQSNEGEIQFTVSLTSVNTDKFWIRFGVQYKSTSQGHAYRTGATDKLDMGAWTMIGTLTTLAANYDTPMVSDTDIATALAINNYLQYGIAFDGASGYGQVTVMVADREA